ncbi:MAG: hypothetical protein AAFQ87_00655 [Bacteroidota bacterium]
MLRIFTLCLSFSLFGSPSLLLSQELLSTIPLKRPPLDEGFYFPYQDENGAAHMILYPYRFSIRVLYLDADFQLIEDIRVNQEGDAFNGFKIVSYMDQPRSLILLVKIDGEDGYRSMIYDKRERSLKRTELEIPLKISSLYCRPFVHEGAFLSLQIPRRGSQVIAHRSYDGYTVQSDTFEIGIEDLKSQYELPETNLLFPITAETGNNLFSNIAKAKLYLYGPMLYLTVEDHKEGSTKLVSVHLDEKTVTSMLYMFPGAPSVDGPDEFNSLIYEDLILLASFEEEVGLRISIYELGFTESSQEYLFEDNQTMDAFFLESEAENNEGESLEGEFDLHSFMAKSLIISLEPTSEGDLWLIVGSLKQLSEGARYAIIFATEIAGALLGASLDPINLTGNISFSPAGGAYMGGDLILAMADQYSKFIYRVGILKAQDLRLKPQAEIQAIVDRAEQTELPPTAFEKMIEFLAAKKGYDPNAASQVMFYYQAGIVKGYATRKQGLQLYYFE